ncbi:MAG: SprT-like domain-containing protein [Planctomycetota bacterium]
MAEISKQATQRMYDTFDRILAKLEKGFPELVGTRMDLIDVSVNIGFGDRKSIAIYEKTSKEDLEPLILHELAHVLEFIRHGEYSGHGQIFDECLNSLTSTFQCEERSEEGS